MGAVLRRAAFSPNIKERADCSAALFTAAGELLVQAEHIPVHLGSMPAAVARRHRRRSAAASAGRPDRAQRPVRRRHAPQRRHARRPVLRRRRARRLGGEPGAPRRPRRDGARFDAAGRDRDLPGRAADPAGPPRRRGGRGARGELAHARPSGAATSTRSVGANRLGVERMRASWTRCGRAGRSTRSSTTANGACAPRSRRCPTGSGSSRTCSTPTGPRPHSSRRRGSRSTLSVDGDDATFDFTGTDAQRAGQRERGRGGDRERGRVRAARRDRSDDPGERRRDAAGARDRADPARSSPRVAPVAVGAGNVEVSQRVADVCLRRARAGRARPRRRREPGHDEQRARRRRRMGVLRDDRRRAGCAAVGRRDERRAHAR